MNEFQKLLNERNTKIDELEQQMKSMKQRSEKEKMELLELKLKLYGEDVDLEQKITSE